MARHFELLIILTLITLLAPNTSLADDGANEFTLLYSNNVNGEIEPCG